MGTPLSTALRSWASENAWEVRLHVNLTDGYCLLFRRPDAHLRWLEVHLNDTQLERLGGALREHGLRRRRHQNGARAFGKALPSKLGRAEVLAQLDAVLNLVDADAAGLNAVTLSCQREQPPENPQLLESIRAVSTRKDDEATRKRLYAAIANATFLVPIRPETVGLNGVDQVPLLVSNGGAPVGASLDGQTWIAFSDWDSLRQWRPEGHPFGLVHGVDLVRHANDRTASGLQINPNGVAGGSLYPSEIDMMAKAVQGYLASDPN